VRQWLTEDDQPGTRTRRGIDQGKKMLTTFWNPNGLHLVNVMPKREKYSTRYYVDNILTPTCQRLIQAGKRKLIIRANNSPCHIVNVVFDFLSQRKVRFAPHPPYCPDIASSGFFLFGDLKRELRGSRFQTAEELLVEIRNWWVGPHMKLY
jgi:hypothetical protein